MVEGYTALDEQRWAYEPEKSRDRTPFERDRARLIHSSALRRLGAKSQVLVAGTDDFARTRLTHTLEVAQIGRQIAAKLGCDPDVVDCACLSHDLGHPPFGHNGEQALAGIASSIGGFEANAQTLRLLTRLEPKVEHRDGSPAGVNLTRACLDAAIKYPWTLDEAQSGGTHSNVTKFCVYPDDVAVFQWVMDDAPVGIRPIECQVMDLSDDIAYSVHDVEDSIATGACDPQTLQSSQSVDMIIASTRAWYGDQWSADGLLEALKRLQRDELLPVYFDGSRRAFALLKNMTSSLIGRFANAVENATRQVHGDGALTRYSCNLVIPQETTYEIMLLKGIAVNFLMEPREHEEFHRQEQAVIEDLVSALMQDSPHASSALEPIFMQDWNRAGSDDERLRVAVDQVASLTDGSALALHAIVC